MENKKYNYFKIYDDKEEFNYIKTSLQRKKVEELLKDYEKTHKKYVNSTFVKFLQKTDKDAEIIKVTDISY